MIEVIYDGNLGNNLFQYSFGRILAEKLGYRLQASPIPGFQKTYDLVDGDVITDDKPILLRGQKPDLTFLDRTETKKKILLTGYFQRAEYYEPYSTQIREWLQLEDTIAADIGPNDVVIGMRRGNDYIPEHGLPRSYYNAALESMHFEKVYICTNEPNDPFVQDYVKRYDAVVRAPGALDNMMFLKKFNKMIISNSTFLWWAAFLSNAEEIVFPRPLNGFWSDDLISKNISLELKDPRYRYLACEKYKSEYPLEMAKGYSDSLIKSSKRVLKNTFPFLASSKIENANAVRFTED